jgi:hypothetical protein
MHTSVQLWFDRFFAECDGVPVDPATLLDWSERDRFGIVVREPFGALGAGLLISLAVTAFYEVAGKDRRAGNLYPEIYLFHVGKRWGEHSPFDFWPERKEVCVGGDPNDLLTAINIHAVTHLAVPDGLVRTPVHFHSELEVARDRIKQCFVYASSGAVFGSNVTLGTTDEGVVSNYAATLDTDLWLPGTITKLERAKSQAVELHEASEMQRVVDYVSRRRNEVSRTDPAFLLAKQRLKRVALAGSLRETYQQIDTATAIYLL